MITLVLSVSLQNGTSVANAKMALLNAGHRASDLLEKNGLLLVDEQESINLDSDCVNEVVFYRSE